MGIIRINTTVYYPPGPWGAMVPVPGASIEIVDRDAPGRGDDRIWSGTTDSNGHVDAMSTSDWQDRARVWVPFPPPGHWENTSAPDLTDICTLVARIRKAPNPDVELIYPYLSDSAPTIPLITPPPWQPGSWISKEQRACVVISHLVLGTTQWNWLYQFLNDAGVHVAEQVLGPRYRVMKKLVGAEATKPAFLGMLQQLASDSTIKAIDVILNLHGAANQVTFADGAVNVSDLPLPSGKLRMLYSTACYGAGHADAWVARGFRVAAGAKKVNANSMTEYPVVLALWGGGAPFATAIEAGENPLTRTPMDDLARAAGFTDVNSDKDVKGNGSLTITTAI